MNTVPAARALLARLLLASFAALVAAPAVASDVVGLGPQLEAVISEAEGAGLPSAQLELKAREGLAKRVPEARIVAVLRELVTSFEHALAVLPDATPAEIEAAAEALRAGASEEALRDIARLESRPSALRSLADLLRLRVSEAEAVRLVSAASRRGDLGLSGLATATAALVSGGASPGDAAEAVGHAVAQGRAPLAAIPVDTRGPLETPPGKPDSPPGGGNEPPKNNGNPNSGNPNNGNQGNGGSQGNAGGNR